MTEPAIVLQKILWLTSIAENPLADNDWIFLKGFETVRHKLLPMFGLALLKNICYFNKVVP